MPHVWFALICLVWSTSFILMKKATLAFSPAAVGLARLAGGAAILALLWWSRPKARHLQQADAVVFACVVVLGFAWPFVMQPWLVARHGSAFVGMMVAFTPLLTIFVSALLGTFPTPRQLVGVLGALVCLCLLMFDSRERNIPIVDLAAAISVPAGYAITNTLIRRRLRHVPSLELALFALIAATILLIPLAASAPAPPATDRSTLLTAIAALAFLGIVGTGLSSWLYNRLIHDQGPLFAAMVTNLVPVGAILLAWADEEHVTPRQVEALAGLIAMVSLVQFGAAKMQADSSLEA